MFFEKLKRWVSNETSNRSGVLSSPVALVVDTSRKVTIPPVMRLEEWLKLRVTPAKAVAFLQIYRDYTNALVVDVERRVLALRIEMDTKSLGVFTSQFLTDDKAELRSILQAPPWLVKAVRRAPITHVAAGTTTAEGSGQMLAMMAFPPDAETNGVRPIGEKPPEPPKVQALITLGEETASLQNLPVIGTSPIAN